jgi:gas vesicle protein
MEDDSNTSKVLWFIAGASIGTSIALLFAPASGETTRATIVQKSGEGRAALAGSGKDMLERGRELFERAKQLTEEAVDMFEKGRKLVEDTAAKVQQG